MRKGMSISFVALLVLVATTLVYAKPGNLDDEIVTPTYSYHVWYTNDTTDGDYFDNTRANYVADCLDPHHERFTDLGFKAPYFADTPKEIWIYNSSDTGGADYCKITLDSPGLGASSENCLWLVTGHELFHHVQYAYIAHGSSSCGGCGSKWGKWTCEGTARLMQDKIFTDLDNDAGCITYQGETNSYLANPNRPITSLSYSCCFLWNYLTEQFGTISAEPEVGVDVIIDYWERAEDADSTDPWGVFKTMVQYWSGNSLSNVFRDFCITNVTKDYDVSMLSSSGKYTVIDTTPLNMVNHTTVTPNGTLHNSSVNSWSAKYFKVDTVPGDCTAIGYKFDADKHLKYALIAIRSGKVVDIFKGSGKVWVKTFLSSPAYPLDELWAVVMGNDDGSSFEYTADQGQVKLDLILPNSTDQAFVGENGENGRFLVWVDITGVSGLSEGGSIMGLETDDFTVRVGTEEAPILSGGYVGGTYMLTCSAPYQPSGGTIFDLRVTICDEYSSTERYSIVYGKIINEKVLVVDASGSMLNPSGNTKIAAARSAAKYMLAGSPDWDYLSVVRFQGNDSEIDDDASVEEHLKEISGNRSTFQSAINSITPSDPPGWMTSIGDGLYTGQTELDSKGDPANPHYMILLSDGKENEARYWNKSYSTLTPVSDFVVPKDTVVHTIGLGEDVNQEVLQDIAVKTHGNYYYVPLESGTEDVAAAVSNVLADTYKSIEERIAKQDRLYYSAGTHNGSDTVLEMVVEKGSVIRNGVVSIHWYPSATFNVNLVDPDGNTLTDSSAGVDVYSEKEHIVYHIDSMKEGKYVATMKGFKGSVEYVASLSGKVVEGVSMDIFFGAMPDDGYANNQYSANYLRGLPMPIWAILTTHKAPLTGAIVDALITRPDGTTNNIQLFDDGEHGDGKINDGVYGNIYTRTDLASLDGVKDGATTGGGGMVGSYHVHVVAMGTYNKADFNRVRDGAFQICEIFDDREVNPDPDKDGMPTRWEVLYGTDPYVNDARQDPDEDNLLNIDEFHQGTDPLNPDTDYGGENDGSEVKAGRDPLYEPDDYLPRPYDVEVLTDLGDEFVEGFLVDNAITLRYPIHSTYMYIHIYRSKTSATSGFTLLTTITAEKAEGYYHDEDVTIGNKYYYKFIAEGESSQISAPSRVIMGIPFKNANPPYGWVNINDGEPTTTGTLVQLTFGAEKSVVNMRYSEDPTFAGVSWVPYEEELFFIVKNPDSDMKYTVYAQFADGYGHLSPVYHNSITLVYEPYPEIHMDANQTSYTGSDIMTVTSKVENYSVKYYADVYLAVWLKPYGKIFWLTPTGWSLTLEAYIPGLEIPNGYNEQFMVMKDLPTFLLTDGQYSWYGFLVYPGTLYPYNFDVVNLDVY